MFVILKSAVAVELRNEDGDWLVMGSDADGREYTHERSFRSAALATRLAERVLAADGLIDPDRWFMRVPYGTNAWLDDGYEDATIWEERYGGLGEGDELAHVV